MSMTVIGVFDNVQRAQQALEAVQREGLTHEGVRVETGAEFVRHSRMPAVDLDQSAGLNHGARRRNRPARSHPPTACC